MNQVKQKHHILSIESVVPAMVLKALWPKPRTIQAPQSTQIAESICLDVLDVDKTTIRPKCFYYSSLTDQFGQSFSAAASMRMMAKSLQDEYSQLIYTAIIRERWHRYTKRWKPGQTSMPMSGILEAMELLKITAPHHRTTTTRYFGGIPAQNDHAI